MYPYVPATSVACPVTYTNVTVTMNSTNNVTRPAADQIKLFDDSKERQKLEELSDLYAIIKATELLEAAYSRDCITSSEYTDACSRIISQFKTTESALISRKLIDSTDHFMKEYQIDCARAYERLVVTGALRYSA